MKFCCAEKKLFFIGGLCKLIKCLFLKPKRFPSAESFTNFTQSRIFTHKNFFCTYLSSLSAKISHFHKPKSFCLHKPFHIARQSNLFPPSIFHSHPAITYCPPKNDAVLFISALNPHAVTPEPRTDSKPFRRRFVRKTRVGSCCRKLFQNYFRQSFESRSQDGVPCAFYVTFCTMQKVTSRSLCREPRGFANLEAARRNDGEL